MNFYGRKYDISVVIIFVWEIEFILRDYIKREYLEVFI